MTEVATWKQRLTESARACRTERSELVAQYIDASRKMAKQLKRLGLADSYQAKQDAERKLRDLYYSRWLSASYPVVDLTFTKAKVELLLKRNASGVDIIGLKDREPNGPTEHVVAVTKYARQQGGTRELSGSLPDPECIIGNFVFPQFQLNRERFRTYSGHVKCNRPEGYPGVLRQRLRDVIAMSLEAHAAGVRAGAPIGQSQFSRAILWEPRIEDMYVTEEIAVRDDPAILVMSGERAHLIGFWDSPAENPIEGVLREFSDGAFDNEVLKQ